MVRCTFIAIGALLALSLLYEHFTALQSLASIFGYQFQGQLQDIGQGRATGYFDTWATPSVIYGVTLFTTLFAAITTKSATKRLLVLCIAAALCVGLFYTYTRQVYLAVAIPLVLLPLFAVKMQKQFLITIAVIVGVCAVLLPSLITDRAFSNRMQAATLTQRNLIAQTVFNVFRDNAFIGVGVAKLPDVQENYAASLAYREAGKDWRHPYGLSQYQLSHNTWLTILAEQGVVGTIAWMFCILGFIVEMLKTRIALRKCNATEADYVSMMMLVVVTYLGLLNFGDAFRNMYGMFYVFAVFAVCNRLRALSKATDITDYA